MGRGGFCCMHCCDGICNGISRLFNLILCVAGLGFVSFGVYLTGQNNWDFQNYFTLSVISAGTFLSLLTGLYSFCCHNRVCYNSFYIYCMVLFIICDGTGAGLLFANSKVVLADLKRNTHNSTYLDEEHIKITGYIGLGLTGLQILAFVLAWCHRGILIDIERENFELEDGYEAFLAADAESSSSGHSKHRSTSELASRSTRSNDTGLKEEESEGSKAANNYRSKYADLYTKYGIDKK